jgi:hypothetical protein
MRTSLLDRLQVRDCPDRSPDPDFYLSPLCAFRRFDRFLECSPRDRGEAPLECNGQMQLCSQRREIAESCSGSFAELF